VAGLTAFTKYYWRVKTNNGGHYSPYSIVWDFSTLTVGLEENNLNKMDISPNPSKGLFTFENMSKGNLLEIFDMQGQVVYKNNADGQVLKINLGDCADGIYFYTVTEINGGQVRGKLVKE
jgi:hypothetical protein